MTPRRKRSRKPGQGKSVLPKSAVTLRHMDTGAMGPANRVGLVAEEAATIDPDTGEAKNPNGMLRYRRVDMLEKWHRDGQLSAAAYTVAAALRDAFCATLRAPTVDLTQDRVDASPKPDHAVAVQVDRLSAFHAIWRRVTRPDDRAILSWCILVPGGHTCRAPGDITVNGVHPYRGSPERHAAGMKRLSDALERLAAR